MKLLLVTAWLASTTVTVVDVGQGDGIIVQNEAGVVLIDAGLPSAKKKILAALTATHATNLEWVMASHQHLDHTGNLGSVIEGWSVDTFIEQGEIEIIPVYGALLTKFREKRIPVIQARTGDHFDLGEAHFQVLGPADPLMQETRSDLNANSVILLMTVGKTHMLFMGDAEPDTLERLGAMHLPDIDILKVAHHGSAWGTSTALLEQVKPEVAVISCGRKNKYGHPHRETVSRLKRAQVQTYRTDLQGTISIQITGTTYVVNTAGVMSAAH